MSDGHELDGFIPESQARWFERRGFLRSLAAWSATGAVGEAFAQTAPRSNIVDLRGDALVNGARASIASFVQTGDLIETGPASSLLFTIGDSVFAVRQNSRFSVERGRTINAVSVLRLLSGAVASVWGRGVQRSIITPTLTAGIRGTAVYVEARSAPNDSRNYLCTCWGAVEVTSGEARTPLRTRYHHAVWIDPSVDGAGRIRQAKAVNHFDDELELMGSIAGQRAPWLISGTKEKQAGREYETERR